MRCPQICCARDAAEQRQKKRVCWQHVEPWWSSCHFSQRGSSMVCIYSCSFAFHIHRFRLRSRVPDLQFRATIVKRVTTKAWAKSLISLCVLLETQGILLPRYVYPSPGNEIIHRDNIFQYARMFCAGMVCFNRMPTPDNQSGRITQPCFSVTQLLKRSLDISGVLRYRICGSHAALLRRHAHMYRHRIEHMHWHNVGYMRLAMADQSLSVKVQEN